MEGVTRSQQDTLRGAIKQFSQNLRISQIELAHSAKVSQPLISRFVAGTTNLSESSMDRVQKALSQLVSKRASAAGLFVANPFQPAPRNARVEA
jgi:predicted transcriptional regulator